MGDSDCEVSHRPHPELAQCHFCCSLLVKAGTDSISTYEPRTCPESQWPCDSAAITGFLPVPLTIPLCYTARPSLYSSVPVHSDTSAGGPSPDSSRGLSLLPLRSPFKYHFSWDFLSMAPVHPSQPLSAGFLFPISAPPLEHKL